MNNSDSPNTDCVHSIYQNNRLLVIDDDTELCDLVAEYLAPEGLVVESSYDGKTGVERASSGNYALIILDVMLPGINGFEVLRRIRAFSAVPVLMLTARGEVVDRVVGLEIGADDYMPKPFNPRELVARIHAILRRTDAIPETPFGREKTNVVEIGDVELDSGSRVVFCKSKPVEVTSAEFNILEMLLRGAGQLVEREDIAKKVLGRRLMPYDRSVDMHISNLRKKLGHLINGQERIKTVRGLGYIYTLPVVSDSKNKRDNPLE